MLMDQTDIKEYFQKSQKVIRAAVNQDNFPPPILVIGKTRYWGKQQVDEWLSGAYAREQHEIDTDDMAEDILRQGMAQYKSQIK